MTLVSKLTVSLSAVLQNALDLVTAQAPLSKAWSMSLASGIIKDAADVIFSDTRTLTTGSTDSLDLAGGGLLDAFGNAFAPVKVKTIIIVANSANTTNLTLFGDAASVPVLNTAATTITLKPGGVFVYSDPSLAGVAVTGTSADIVKIVNGSGASATYDIVIIGTSA